MTLQAVTYVYGGSAEALAEHRPVHRQFLGELEAAGVLLAAGPYDDDAPAGALLIVQADSPEQALEVLDPDPLLVEQVITERTARPWKVTVGRVR
ncbi:YciI family protein [Kocuria sp.]|uniref:YciI family protein n=1 Tax=Kocuria sp. TaxID=1871328 RepID=UPI0026E0EEFD|nr:YciI family protein [Kocuria sp.]MDO5619119.1 YciI family protein [Kocuria sp.]